MLKIFQHLRRNFVSPRSNVIFFLLCKILAIQQRSNKYSISSGVYLGLTSPQRQFAAAAKAEMWRSKLAKMRRVFYLISRERKLGTKLFWIYDVKCFFLAFKFINKIIISIGIILTEWEEFSYGNEKPCSYSEKLNEKVGNDEYKRKSALLHCIHFAWKLKFIFISIALYQEP